MSTQQSGRCLRKRLREISSALIFSLATSAVLGDTPRTYTIGVVPQFEALRLTTTWAPILRQVGAKAGVTIELVGSPSIPAFEQNYNSGSFDFAYMNPYHAIDANKTQGYKPILRDGERLLFGILVVEAASDITTVEQLEGRHVAFPAPNALGASLLIRAALDQKYAVNVTPVYAQTHSSSYLNVILGQTGAAGGVRSTLDQQPTAFRDRLRVIYETQRVPAHPIVAHPRVPAEVAKRVQAAFIELAQTPDGRAMLARIPMGNPIPASMTDYGGVEALNLDRYATKLSNEGIAHSGVLQQ